MLTIIFTYYCSIACLVFSIWLVVFLKDKTTPKTDLVSWLVLILGSVAWLIVLPIASLELTYNYHVKRAF